MLSKLTMWIFKALPYKFLVKIYPRIKKTVFEDIIESVYNERFYKESQIYNDFDSFIKKAKSFKKYCLIREGNWDYRVINICFLREMTSNIIWSLENGYKPLIDIDANFGVYSEHTNLWEKMFFQPFLTKLNEVKEKENYIVCPIKSHIIMPKMVDALDPVKSAFWSKMFDEFIVFNNECKEYLEKEYLNLIKGKKVLACLGRGTDYTDLKPKGHPVQPTINELIEKVKTVFYEQELDYIYLATEGKKISDSFQKVFPGKILENKRQYYDSAYDNDDTINRVASVSFDRENDDFLKALEYMSSINLLSKCDSIVAGLCGGSEAAVYFNKGNYKVCYLFDKGLY